MKDNPPKSEVKPDYAEFDDLNGAPPGYVDSKKARAEIGRLMAEHGLGYLGNPGGGQFTCIDSRYPLNGFDCQISACDDVEDLATLRAAIKRALAHGVQK
jgi:hypothetical protein